jgi:Rieske Fe-S protein
MDRKDFIVKTGMFATVCVCAGACVLSKDEPIEPKKNEKTDFTIDLNNSKFVDLQIVGGFVYEKLIIITKVGVNEFIAFTQYCTHAAGVVKFVPSKNHFQCLVHGSLFDLDGKVLQSPANEPLKKYKTELSGSLLRIFE